MLGICQSLLLLIVTYSKGILQNVFRLLILSYRGTNIIFFCRKNVSGCKQRFLFLTLKGFYHPLNTEKCFETESFYFLPEVSLKNIYFFFWALSLKTCFFSLS